MGLFGSSAPQPAGPTQYQQNAQASYGSAFGDFMRNTKNNPLSFFPGQTYADLNPSQQQAQQGMMNMGQTGFGGYTDFLGNMARQGGGYGAGSVNAQGPTSMAQYRGAITDPAVEQMASRFASMGRYGSPGSAQQMVKSSTEALAPYFHQAQESAAQRGLQAQMSNQQAGLASNALNAQMQQQAMQQFPAISMMGPELMMQAGNLDYSQAQKGIDEAMARHDFGQNADYQRMQQYAGLMGAMNAGPSMGGTVGGGSKASGMLGGAMAGAKLGSMLMPGVGTAVGAIGGGLLGGFG